MKTLILLLCSLIFVPSLTYAQFYRHKSEAKIISLTSEQRVDEMVGEYLRHRYDVLDEQGSLIEKYVAADGTKGFLRIKEIIDEYDPTRRSGKSDHKGDRFDACWMVLNRIDSFARRLRSTSEGQELIDSLERAVKRMQSAGFGQPDEYGWERHGRFESVIVLVTDAKGINDKDRDIQNTLRFSYKTILTDAELSELSNYLVKRHPQYPSWSKRTIYRDYSQLTSSGLPMQLYVLMKPEPYYEAYLEFKKTE